MHTLLAKQMVEKIRERVDQGDCPTIAPYSVEQLEDLVLTLARSHDESMVLVPEDLAALNEFTKKYPTWWWKIGYCSVSRDFDCAPQRHSPEVGYAIPGNVWDSGFSCDHKGSIADAINHVMAEIEHELSELSAIPEDRG